MEKAKLVGEMSRDDMYGLGATHPPPKLRVSVRGIAVFISAMTQHRLRHMLQTRRASVKEAGMECAAD